jgi:phosphate transport system protein
MLSADADLERAREECERHAWSLLALQAPVAGGLWTILAAVYSAKKIERMGDRAATSPIPPASLIPPTPSQRN